MQAFAEKLKSSFWTVCYSKALPPSFSIKSGIWKCKHMKCFSETFRSEKGVWGEKQTVYEAVWSLTGKQRCLCRAEKVFGVPASARASCGKQGFIYCHGQRGNKTQRHSATGECRTGNEGCSQETECTSTEMVEYLPPSSFHTAKHAGIHAVPILTTPGNCYWTPGKWETQTCKCWGLDFVKRVKPQQGTGGIPPKPELILAPAPVSHFVSSDLFLLEKQNTAKEGTNQAFISYWSKFFHLTHNFSPSEKMHFCPGFS